ncbi:hypothetical protein GOBAR_DD19371 [Gossypium barbadense]|nr:hypothetical protein GOBAR_DD19371 [Gossypium barbadense]
MTCRLGATPVMELMIAAGKTVPKLQLEFGLLVERVYTGSFMTSLDMKGFSISIMKVDQTLLQHLDASTKAPHWPVGSAGNRPPAKTPVPLPSSRSMKSDEVGPGIIGYIKGIPFIQNMDIGLLGALPKSKECREIETSLHLLSRPLQLSEQGHILEVAIEAAANAIINMRDILNDWDSTIGDGDCGSAMYKGATAILDDMKKYCTSVMAMPRVLEKLLVVMLQKLGGPYPLNNAAETVNEIGSSVRRAMGGTSGVLYTIFCKAAYAQLKANSDSTVTAKQWAEALEAAIAAVSKYGGASTGYRTLLDALIPALAVLKERLTSGEDSCTSFVLSSEAAVAGAGSTKDMQAQAGRSSYVSAAILATVPDPGARQQLRGTELQLWL